MPDGTLSPMVASAKVSPARSPVHGVSASAAGAPAAQIV